MDTLKTYRQSIQKVLKEYHDWVSDSDREPDESLLSYSINAVCALFALTILSSESKNPPFPIPPSPRARGFWRIKLHMALLGI